MEIVHGAAATVVKPAFDKVQYWIELLQGKHTSTEEMVNELDILEGLIKDTDSSGAIHTLKAARGQAEDLCANIRDVIDDAKRFARYNHQHVPLRCIRKYTHNIVGKPSICETAERIAKLHSQVRRLREILTPFVGQGMVPSTARAGRLQDRHVAHAEGHWEGMEEPKTSLIQYVLSGASNRQVIALVGMPGVGKTSLARYVYEDNKVKGHFSCHAWMTVEESCETKQLLLGIVSRLYEEANVRLPDAINIMDEDELSAMIQRFLKQEERRYIIVFDDISRKGQLKLLLDLAFPDKNYPNYGRIIVTSRNKDVSEACDHTITVTQLTSPDDWKLFCYKAFGSSSFPPGDEICQHREQISKLCAGLPLAIDVLSALLAKKDHSQWSSIISELEIHGDLGAATEILETSINELPNMGHKSCLLYFSMFPKSSTVSHNTLVRLWIAEGFIKCQPRQRQAVAEKYLSDLVDHHVLMVEDSYKYGRPKSYKVHDLMYQVIQKKAENEDFCTSSYSGSQQAPLKVRRMSIQIEDDDFRQNVSLSKLQTLFISNKIPHFPKLLSSTTALKVLSMEGSLIEDFPKEIGNLTHLRYLNLRNTKITDLPMSLGNLTNLETLNLKGTFISELPKTILKMHSLHHLLAYRYDAPKKPERQPEALFGVRVPKGIGQLKELRTFSVVVADKERKIVKELINLKKLRRLGVLNLRREDGSDLCDSIARMDQLSSISITAMDDEYLDIHNLSVVPPQLQRLYLRGRLQVVPQWFTSLHCLVRLLLSGSSLNEDSINILQSLPQLAELSLIRALNVDSIECQTGGFRNLKILDLDQLNGLVNVALHGSMINLHKMIIRNCRSLQMVPLGTEQLIQLQELHFFDMPNNFLERLRNGNEDHARVQHIRNILYYSKGFPHRSVEAAMRGVA
uniref:Uncharacterized protein n=1 Tax=Leersia perrieri TaxID=77586 RepID=A0A0D9X7Z2_9ORYZ